MNQDGAKIFRQLQRVVDWAQFLLFYVPAISNKDVLLWLVGLIHLVFLSQSETSRCNDTAPRLKTDFAKKVSCLSSTRSADLNNPVQYMSQAKIPQAQQFRLP